MEVQEKETGDRNKPVNVYLNHGCLDAGFLRKTKKGRQETLRSLSSLFYSK